MSKTTKPLTNTEVSQAKPKGKEYNLADGGGLLLRVKPNGSKSWIFNYSRPFTKKRANISFGKYPTLSLAEARKKREEAKKLLAQDIDPQEHRDEQARLAEFVHNNTLEQVAGIWFEIKKGKVTPDYADDIWRSLEMHIFPNLGKLPIHKVSAPRVIDALRPLAAKGSLETVKRVCQRINEIMVYSVNTGLIDNNSLAGIRDAFQTPEKKHMPSLRPEELPELMQALSRASIKLTTRCLIEWQLHTMTRPIEAAGTKWGEIDLENRVWLIPEERMKMGRAHRIPLTDQMIALLEAVRPISGDRAHTFPGDRNPNKHAHEQTANTALKRMGFGGRLVAHGLRSIASTTLNENGFDPDLIEAALSHADSNEVRRAYNRSDYLDRRREMMEWWSEFIDRASQGSLSIGRIN